ncbi:MAG: UDP-N-acetylglucosamine 2-epimerase (non-hydrolyzing) [Methanosphaera sp.]|nr:UDP-N-acetylglucosamine 2-epimerase (non-hydrolyzing) [Methanosphaera sp.]
MKIAVILGTRPEIIKMAPVIDQIKKNNSECILIHTGQHYDSEMSRQFFIDLKLQLPDYNIGIGSNTALKQIGIIIAELEEILTKENVDIVLVQGDTNAVLAGSLAANKLKIPVGHVESGLRSFDKNMPEETNRILADNCTKLFFVPTKETALNLQNEGFNHKDIHITGNTIVDACFRHKDIAEEKATIKDELLFDEYITLTMHRAENVDDEDRLRSIVDALIDIDENIVFPMHPHTKKSLINLDLYDALANCDNIQITKPLGYLDFLYLVLHSKLILTDSGGLQEEAITLNVPCITLRYNTERPETISAGANILAGTTSNEISRNINMVLDDENIYNRMSNAPNPYGDGKSSAKIYNIIKKYYDEDSLNITSADEITDFKGYYMKHVSEDITVNDFESLHRGHIIEEVFDGGRPVYIEDDLKLENMDIVVREFSIDE